MSDWKKLGEVVRCQIHTDRMVHDGVYREELRTEVDKLWLSPDGVVGLAEHTAPVDVDVGDEFWVRT